MTLKLKRRELLFTAAAAALGPTQADAQQRNQASISTPRFPTDLSGIGVLAGIRPTRVGSYRLEYDSRSTTDMIGGKRLFHNYGHGGGGITLSWGCANWVRDDFLSRGVSTNEEIAILGSGVIGLTTATALREAGFKVRVYSSSLSSQVNQRSIVSYVAGGQFLPSFLVEPTDVSAQAIARTKNLTENSWDEFKRRGITLGQASYVSEIDNYTMDPADHFRSYCLGRVTETRLASLPFSGLQRRSGYVYKTLLVDSPLFMDKLFSDLNRIPNSVVMREFKSLADILALTESVIVNCLGVGARFIENDLDGQVSIQGHYGVLAKLPAQRNINYLFSDVGYLFSRRNDLIVGGSAEPVSFRDLRSNQFSLRSEQRWTDLQKAQMMVRIMSLQFQDGFPIPSWYVGRANILN